MKKILGLSIAGLLGLFVILIMWGVGVNNQLITMEESVKASRSQVENVYQRRLDLIPNLVNTVKGYARHEAQVFQEVAKARSQAGQVTIQKPEDLAKFDQAQGQLSSALSRLMVVAERYPELKANQNFRDLQSQLEGTENRITIERQRFNETAREFNTYIRRFPQTLIASFRGFQQFPYFQADPAAQTAPRVEF